MHKSTIVPGEDQEEYIDAGWIAHARVANFYVTATLERPRDETVSPLGAER